MAGGHDSGQATGECDSALSRSSATHSRNPLDLLAEQYLERYRSGEEPSITEFVALQPELEDEIRELFPTLLWMEQLAPRSSGRKVFRKQIPKNLGDYRIIRETGRGGMGIVYEAEQISLDRRVALKVLPYEISADSAYVRRFQREARAAGVLHHPHIVPVYDVGAHEDVYFYSMPFVDGWSFDEVLAELRRLRTRAQSDSAAQLHRRRWQFSGFAPVLAAGEILRSRSSYEYSAAHAEVVSRDEVCSALGKSDEDNHRVARSRRKGSDTAVNRGRTDIVLPGGTDLSSAEGTDQFWKCVAQVGCDVAGALACAHSHDIYHRDIKPSNLMVDRDGVVWVTDFGLAHAGAEEITRSGNVVGTLRFMAPERLQGESDGRSDIYSLGITLYELATLQPAFEPGDRSQLIRQIAEVDPPAPRSLDRHIPHDLETIILKAIDKEPDRRYQSAAQLADDLQRFLDDRPILARRVSWAGRVNRWRRRNPLAAMLLGCVFVLLLAMAWGGFRLHQQSESLRRRERSAVESVLDAQQVTMSPSGRWLVTRDGNVAAMMNVDTRVRVRSIDGVIGLPQFSSNERWLLIPRRAGWDIQDVSTGHTVRQVPAAPDAPAVAVSSVDGRMLAFATGADGIHLFDARSLGALAVLPLPEARVPTTLTFSPDGSRLVAGTIPHGIVRWNLRRIRDQLTAMDREWDQPSADVLQFDEPAASDQ